MTVAETIAIIISIISIIFTSVLACLQIINSNRCNNQNLKASLIKDMYENTLVVDIPRAREYIHFDGKHISGVDNLIDAISSIRRSSLYFKATNDVYYKKIFNKWQEAEDYLNDSSGEYSTDKFATFLKNVDELLDTIYEIINKEYSGKK